MSRLLKRGGLLAAVLAAVAATPAAVASPPASVQISITAASPPTMTIGSSLRAEVTNVNTTGGTLQFRDAFTLHLPDGSQLPLLTYGSGVATIPSGASVTASPSGLATAAVTPQTGRFVLEAQAVDAVDGTVLG